MKKLLVIMLTLVMVLSLVACQGEKKEEPAPVTEGTEPVAENTPEPVDETTPEPAAEPVVLADETHALWTAHGQYLLADGTQNGWNGKDTEVYEASALTAIALEDVKAIDEDVYNALAAKDVKYLYTIDLIFGTNDAGWTTDCLIGGKLFKANGSYAFKIAQCTVDVDGDNKVYAEDQWIHDPKTAHSESLTPDTLFVPVWQEEADENGFSWASNPVVIGGAGLYTLVIAQYNNPSTPDQAGYGIALVMKEAKEGIAYEEILEWVAADHTYGIIGGFNEWGSDVAMTDNGDGTWSGEVELTAGTEFKVRADGAWDYSWGDPSTENGNCVVDADGTYVVTISFATGEGVVTAEAK
jgi:hypothetical protein